MQFKMPFKRLHEERSVEWLEYIASCASRSNNALESVIFASPFPDVLLEDILYILRSSAPTLTHIEIPTERQRICYELLYRCCPRLKSLRLYFGRCEVVPVISHQVRDRDTMLEATKAAEHPFSLEVLQAGYFNRGLPFDLVPHTSTLRVLRGCGPWDLVPGGKLTARQYVQFLSTFASNVEEWTGLKDLRRPRFVDTEDVDRPVELAFPQLTKLGHYCPTETLKMTCPRLLETAVSLHIYAPDPHSDQWAQGVARFLRSSPLLRKLKLRDERRHFQHFSLHPALRDLRELEDFEFLACEAPVRNYVSRLLLPKAVDVDGRQVGLDFPFPNLQRLTVDGKEVDTDELVLALIVREQLRSGKDLLTAKRIAAEQLKSLQKTYVGSNISPSQKEQSPIGTSQTSEHECGLSLAQQEAERCCQLQTLKLRKIRELPAYLQPTLESIGVKLTYSYDRSPYNRY